jgi:hypothetical protein
MSSHVRGGVKSTCADGLSLAAAIVSMGGAVITAAVLCHGVHVYGGFSREEIRTGALMAIPVVVLAVIFFRRKRRQQ